jgi:hypothetical protein
MSSEILIERTRERFLLELRHHFQGWLAKVTKDLSIEQFKAEITNLEGDPVYRSFGLATAEYALVRVMGRLSISIGRRLGEIYDKIPRFVTQARFNLTAAEVAPKVGGSLELDVCIPLARLNSVDAAHVREVVSKTFGAADGYSAVAIEIRYNFNPNDSSRLRKDVHMAELLKEQGMLPVYLIFSTISPRDEAIARLKRAGWTFMIGQQASEFMNALIGMDIEVILSSEAVKSEVALEMDKIMRTLYESSAMNHTLAKYVG